jgi:hypothetical protein
MKDFLCVPCVSAVNFFFCCYPFFSSFIPRSRKLMIAVMATAMAVTTVIAADLKSRFCGTTGFNG